MTRGGRSAPDAPRIPFSAPALREDAAAVRSAIDRVLASGWFILGPEVDAFEDEFAAASGAACAIGVGNGTDAIALILRALDIGSARGGAAGTPGSSTDEVITTPLSAAYTALAIVMAGARPVFADIDPIRMTIDPDAIERAITPRTRGIVPVHLYGQAADMTAIERIASRHNLAIVEDCCQAHFATSKGRNVGTIGAAGAFSFYPTKNLGALGDGGAVVTNDRALADRIKRLRNGGQTSRYTHVETGVNSRLDEVQAAILRARLPFLREWTDRRRTLARVYRERLIEAPVAVMPEVDPGHVYHLFVVRSSARVALQQHLSSHGIDTLVHYPISIPTQAAFASFHTDGCVRAEEACNQVLSLPLYPALDHDTVRRVADAIRGFRATDG
jgi:dTDP-4-amino-4,6-dideoxygalactose transaminase